MNNKNNYIWLFGENVGETANNNSFYFWKHSVEKYKDDIEKYFVVKKNKKNIEIYKTLTNEQKKYIIWKNSLKHYRIFKRADMYYVSLSYRDIIPENKLWNQFKFKIKKPVIYLQHGTLLMKKLGYKGNSYNNSLFRFIYYNKFIKEKFIEENDFRDYQLYYGIFHPRYKELARLQLALKQEDQKQILWFLTWREYLGKNSQSELLIRKIKHILKNEKLNEYLNKNNIKLKIYLHQFFNNEIANVIKEFGLKNIEIADKNTDLMQEIVKSNLLITDYSSLAFDFTILNKPVILFQPDLEEYMAKREFYCDVEEMSKYAISNSNRLIEEIVGEKYTINEFIRKRCPDEINLKEISEGKYIDRMYEDFRIIQENKITFLGYNFYGVGGTVSATKALAEGLLEKRYLVELISIKRTSKPKEFPYALMNSFMYNAATKRILPKIKMNIVPNKYMSYLKNDSLSQIIKPYAPYKLTKILKTLKSNTVISTRESLHLFLLEANSEKIKNKVYYFHCHASLIDELFPSLMEQLKERKIDKAAFVTEKNKQEIEKKFNYSNYNSYWISGNTLERKNCVELEDIEAVKEKKIYKAIYLLRVSKERKDDIDNLIGFAKYLKENNVTNVIIDVFGDGTYVDQFLDILEAEDLMDFIHYRGKTKEPAEEIRKHDLVIDFSKNQSFGMTYLEGILNGKMVYCMRNVGSEEVMKDIDNCFIESYEDLLNKINNIPKIPKETLKENYIKIWNRYSRKKLADDFIQFLEKN